MDDREDVLLMKECIDDARRIVLEKRLMESQSSIVNIAIALYDSRSSNKNK